MEVAADPYELKLYQMFQNCDAQRSGLLDEQSLRVLCENLELQDKGSSLIANLAAVDGGKTRVSFAKFKEALLNYLGNEFDGSSTTIGAPSAAAATATTTTTPVTTNKSNTTNTNALTTTKTQQSGATATTQTTEKILVISDNAETVIDSPSELSDREVSPKLIVGSKKYGRRSRPGSIRNLEEFALTDSDRGADDESINNRLVQRSSSQTDIPGGGSTNGRRRRPLVPTGNKLKRCSSLPAQRNMHNLRTSKLITTNTTSGRNEDNNEDDDDNDSIEGLLKPPATGMGSSVESLEFCKGVEEIYSTTTTGRDHEVIPPYDGYEPPERWRRYQAKDSPPTHLESLPIQSIVEIWEQANIPHGRRILLALGFTDSSVNLLQLHKVLDEEIRGIDDDPDQFVRAALSLKSAELSMLRQTYRQLHDENAKLRSDNKEANRRLAYLAAEIDERHASLEETSQREIRLLEQRQANVVRDLTAKMQNDRENWTSLMARMEARVKQFEQNEIKLRTEVELVRRENSDFETEHKRLQKQLAEVLEKNIQLNREIAELEDVSGERDAAELRVRCAANTSVASVVSADEEMVASLMEKISKLQMENTGLRDKNDECVAELESLTLELKRLKVKAHKKSAAAGEAADEGASTADDSEHSGAGATATKRRGDSPSKAHVTEESPRLGKQRKCAADGEASEASDTSGEWMALNSELRQVHAGSAELVAELRKKIADLEEKLAAAQGNGDKEASPSSKSPTPEERCKELELSLEQMQRAYEDCEDYWQSKLSEERQLFEKERQLYEDEHQESDKKFTELMEKVREYEEQFSKDGRLSPIEEKYSLEQQYVELEQEVEELREQSRTIIEEKSSEIEALQSEIEDLRLRLGESVEILTGACEMSTSGAAAGGDGPGGVHQSPASSPISYLWHQSTIQEPAKSLGEQIAIDINVSSAKNRINLSTSETAIFSTTPVSSGESGGGEGGSSANESPSTLSPIQKPQHSTTTTTTTPSTMGAATTPTRTTTTTKGAAVESEGGDIADCDTSSTTSGRSFETHSVSSGAQRKGTKGSEASCTSPSSVKEELKRLKFFEISLKEQIKDLSLQRDGLVMELQQLQEARPVLEKAYARTAHPTLIQRVNQLELRNRHLQNVIKQQQQYTESLMQQSWQQHQIELSDLHGRIENQGILISEQVQRLQNADILVKDLYVENSHLTATIQRFEQQRVRANMMQQQQQQHHQQQQHIMQQQQLHALNGLAGMP